MDPGHQVSELRQIVANLLKVILVAGDEVVQ